MEVVHVEITPGVLKQCFIPAAKLESLAAFHSIWGWSTYFGAVVLFIEVHRTEARKLQRQNRHLSQAGVLYHVLCIKYYVFSWGKRSLLPLPPDTGVNCWVCIRWAYWKQLFISFGRNGLLRRDCRENARWLMDCCSKTGSTLTTQTKGSQNHWLSHPATQSLVTYHIDAMANYVMLF